MLSGRSHVGSLQRTGAHVTTAPWRPPPAEPPEGQRCLPNALESADTWPGGLWEQQRHAPGGSGSGSDGSPGVPRGRW